MIPQHSDQIEFKLKKFRECYSDMHLANLGQGLKTVSDTQLLVKKRDSTKSVSHLLRPKELERHSKFFVPRVIYRESLSSKHILEDEDIERKPTLDRSFDSIDSADHEHKHVQKIETSILEKCEFGVWETHFETFYIDASENYSGNYDNYLSSSLKLLNILPKINWEPEIAKRRFKLEGETDKKTLILDLDETLIHSDMDYVLTQHDKVLHLKSDDQEHMIPIIFRPGLNEFLEYVSQHFEIICFTASCKDYADIIIDYIDPEKKYFKHRLYRESCLYLQPGIYIKDLTIIENRDLANVVIIDNSLLSFANHLANGILVSSFYYDKEDNVLDSVIGYLDSVIKNAKDVREANCETFGFDKYKEELQNIVQEEINLINMDRLNLDEAFTA